MVAKRHWPGATLKEREWLLFDVRHAEDEGLHVLNGRGDAVTGGPERRHRPVLWMNVGLA